jgi:hypothetical protein
VLDELRLRGMYTAWARRTVEHERLLMDESVDDQIGNGDAQADDEKLSNIELAAEHIRATACRVPMPYHRWTEEIGVRPGRLRVDLVRAREARRRAARRMQRLVDVAPA